MVSLRSFWITVSVLAVTVQASYTPTIGQCPANFKLVRRGGEISTKESAYIAQKKKRVLPGAFSTFYKNVKASKQPIPAYVKTVLEGRDLPTVGIAISGGGYRAAIYGAGVLNGLDGRNASAVKAGTAGLMQAASYISGLSGGSWLATSLIDSDFPPIREMIFGNDAKNTDGWVADRDILNPSTDAVQNQGYIMSIAAEIAGKWAAGFPVSVNDLWSRALSRHFLSGTTDENFFDVGPHGAGKTFSGFIERATFKKHIMPFPIILWNVISPGQKNEDIQTGAFVPISNPVFEVNPFEMGSFDPSLTAFTPTEYMGTRNTSTCVKGFDQASFVTGASSYLFTTYNATVGAIESSAVGPLFALLKQAFPQINVRLDLSPVPSPFRGVADKFIGTNEDILDFLDGGLDGQVIPIQPLLIKSRKLDVIIAVDGSSDENGFTQGGSLIATAKHAALHPTTYSFPKVPATTKEFLSQNLAAGPTFFGCDETKTPLVVWLPNGFTPPGQTPVTNTTTGQIAYKNPQVEAMLSQTFTMTTQGRVALNRKDPADKEWPVCLACAVAERGRSRMVKTRRSGACERCFHRYCWVGKAL